MIDINVLIRSGHFKVMCTYFTTCVYGKHINEMQPDGMLIRGLATGADTGRYESSHCGLGWMNMSIPRQVLSMSLPQILSSLLKRPWRAADQLHQLAVRCRTPPTVIPFPTTSRPHMFTIGPETQGSDLQMYPEHV